jgi:hypothetical protein
MLSLGVSHENWLFTGRYYDYYYMYMRKQLAGFIIHVRRVKFKGEGTAQNPGVAWVSKSNVIAVLLTKGAGGAWGAWGPSPTVWPCMGFILTSWDMPEPETLFVLSSFLGCYIIYVVYYYCTVPYSEGPQLIFITTTCNCYRIVYNAAHWVESLTKSPKLNNFSKTF